MLTHADKQLIEQALKVLEERAIYKGAKLSAPSAVREYLRLRISPLEHEVFIAIWLDAQNQLIGHEEMFRGSLTQTSVYPREVVKSAMASNAAAVIFAHNHPSGHAEPSRADDMLTQNLKTALGLVDVRLLDHFVVGASDVVSYAERGLL